MSRVVTVVFALLITIPSPALAQEFGIKGGLTLANINITEPRRLPAELQWCCSPWDGTRHDMAVGLFGVMNVKPGVAVQAEVLFTRRGFRIDAAEALPGARLRMSYVEVPVLLQYVGGLVRLHAGGSVGLATSSSQWTTDVSHSGDFLSRESLARVDWSFVIGASLHRGRASVEGRYVHGLRNVMRDGPSGASLKHKSLMLLIGLRLAGDGCTCEVPPKGRDPGRR
ncbi:MAG: PorT family protein [Acidobacteria bacterium]|nr:PorT family protein [Acidobacteriota bacterium]